MSVPAIPRLSMSPEEHSDFWRKVQFTVDKDVVRTDRSNHFFRGENNPNVEIMRSGQMALSGHVPLFSYSLSSLLSLFFFQSYTFSPLPLLFPLISIHILSSLSLFYFSLSPLLPLFPTLFSPLSSSPFQFLIIFPIP